MFVFGWPPTNPVAYQLGYGFDVDLRVISAKCCSFSAVSAPILQENMRFAAFFKIYQILNLKFLKFDKILQILRHLQFFAEISRKLLFFQTDFLRKF